MAEKKAKLSLPSMQSASKLLGKLLYPVRTHSNFLMMLVALGLLAYSVIMISTIIQQRDDQDYRDKQSANRIKSSFDKDTIQKVDNLKNSSDSSSIDLPAGRRNPFVN